jgi:hypothetical protein
LSCCLQPNSQYAQTLITASDCENANIEEREIQAIAEDVLSRLDKWSTGRDLARVLKGVTIGSRFRLDDTAGIVGGAPGVWLAPNQELQRRYLPVSRLSELWGPYIAELPPLLDFDSLRSTSRLHNSVSEVLLPSGEVAIFKGVVRVVASMYHEIRELLRMPPHPNIMSRPPYLVTRRVPGLKEPAVCGFILKRLSGGSLLSYLSNLSPEHPLPLPITVKWIRQIISALLHVYGPARTYHSALRLDNIILDEGGNVVLADFEQRGTSRRWLPPPLWQENQPGPVLENADWAESPVNPARMPKGIFYSCPPHGYHKDFIRAPEWERQGFEAYSLAKVMWCLFEGETNELSLMDLRAEELETRRGDGTALKDAIFPNFRRTPARMRYWIWLCTRQSREWGETRCMCAAGDEGGLVCSESGSRKGGISEGLDASHRFPGILATHLYFETWAADQAV